jgi:hypothetical protein
VDSSSINLPGSEIDSISLDDAGTLRVHFSRAYIIKTMTGSVERTRWWQAGDLVIEDANLATSQLPAGPLVCAGGDVVENIYTYRDMIPVPLESRGSAGCKLRFEGCSDVLEARGSSVRLEMRETAKYIEHLVTG